MRLKQIPTVDVNRVLFFDVNRILLWDVWHALTRPVRHPLLKALSGWVVGLMVFGMGSILMGAAPGDAAINLMAIAFGLLCAFDPWTPLKRRESNRTEGPAS